MFSTHFAINLFNLQFLKCKQTMEQQPNCTYEQTKSKQKQNQVMSHLNRPWVLLFDLGLKQCTVIIRWLHCLISCQ